MSEPEWWREIDSAGRWPSSVQLSARWPDSIRIVNLRSLSDTGPLALPRLVVLVGANGSGKSTFARFFPLLKQSVETPTRGPVLWYQQDFVDFGSFHDAVRRDPAGERCGHMAFHFELAPFRIGLRIEGDRRDTRLVQVTVTGSSDDEAILGFDPAGRLERFAVGDDVDMLALDPDARWIADLSGVIPRVWDHRGGERSSLTGPITDHLSWVFHGKTTRRRKEEFTQSLYYSDSLKDQFAASGFGQKWAGNSKQFFSQPALVAKLRRLLLARIVPGLLNTASVWLDAFARGVAYIGPFRATPQRFYRQQDLAVDAIDPKGSNLAMFLRSLSEAELERLNEWLNGIFALRIGVGADGSQDTINLDFGANGSFNLVDTGFGYSQILPVVVQLWATAFREDSPQSYFPLSVVVVEQPELHLHPHQQALFARALAAVVRARRARLVIETHSEAIISELGAAVEQGELDPRDLSVLCFEPASDRGASNVRVATYNAEGGLENWPVGFFTP